MKFIFFRWRSLSRIRIRFSFCRLPSAPRSGRSSIRRFLDPDLQRAREQESAPSLHTRVVVPAPPSRRRRRELRRRRHRRPKRTAAAVVLVVVDVGCSPSSAPASSDLGSGSAEAALLERRHLSDEIPAKNVPPRSCDDGGGSERGRAGRKKTSRSTGV